MTSSNSDYLLEASLTNTITLGLRASTCEFGGRKQTFNPEYLLKLIQDLEKGL